MCPAGKELRQSWRRFQTIRYEPRDTSILKYGALKADCEACHLREQSCSKGAPRRILRSEHEGARQIARNIAKTDEFDVSTKLRKKVEMLFVHLKRILGLGRLRLRGPCGANDELVLAAIAQNLRKLAKFFPMPRPPKPA
ncbi:MAG: transposase [Pseudomonadota bacterium]